jgi:potassium channel
MHASRLMTLMPDDTHASTRWNRCRASPQAVVDALIGDSGGDVDLNFKDRWGGTALADAVREGHKELAEALHKRGASLEFSELKAAGELCERAMQGDVQRIKLLLDLGCSPNACDYDKRTVLHVAASEGHKNIVADILQRKGNVNLETLDRWGGTPLQDAIREGHKHVAEMLQPK